MNRSKVGMFRELYHTLHWTLSILKSFRWRIFLYVVLLMLKTFFELYITYNVGNIVDYAVEDDMQRLLYKGIYFFGLFIVNAILSITTNRFSAVNYNKMNNSLMLQTYKKIVDSSWEDLVEFHSGDLITRLNNDVKGVAGNTSGLLPTFISETIMIVGAVAMIIYFDYSMLLVAALVGPVVLLSSRIFMHKIYQAQMEIRNMESEINSYNKETFNNIQAVKAFGLGNLFYEKMDKLEQRRLKIDLKSNKYSLYSWITTYLVTIFGAVVCIGWTFYRVHAGVITFGTLAVLITLAGRVGTSLKTLLGLVPTMMEYIASADRIRVLLNLVDEQETQVTKEVDALVDSAMEHGVQVYIDKMCFSYKNGYQVFDHGSMVASPGEIIAVVGPSGEGKTTLLRIILGIINAQEGEVQARISGEREIYIPFGKDTRQLISYVPQGNTMMMGTIADNMRMMDPMVTDEEIWEVLRMACAYDFVVALPDGIDHRIGENGIGFSEGQNQRLAIARALVRKTPIMLMDEATSALDVVTERKVLKNIMQKDAKRTCILTTHRPSVLSMCDRVYHISDKKISVLGQDDIQKIMDEF